MIEMRIKVDGRRVYFYPLLSRKSLNEFISLITSTGFNVVASKFAHSGIALENMLIDNISTMNEIEISRLVLRREKGK